MIFSQAESVSDKLYFILCVLNSSTVYIFKNVAHHATFSAPGPWLTAFNLLKVVEDSSM